MNTVHLSLFPPHENARAHTHSRNHSQKRSRGGRGVGGGRGARRSSGIRGGGMWFCSGGLRDEIRKRWREAYSSNVRKLFCMSSNSWAYSALIFASPSFTGSWIDREIQSEHKAGSLSRLCTWSVGLELWPSFALCFPGVISLRKAKKKKNPKVPPLSGTMQTWADHFQFWIWTIALSNSQCFYLVLETHAWLRILTGYCLHSFVASDSFLNLFMLFLLL